MKPFILILTFFFSLPGQSHPVIYKGGWALSSANMTDYSNNYLMYSPTNRWAIGIDQWRWTSDSQNNEAGFFKLNGLLWRDNGKLHQANLYLHGGVGVLDQEIKGPGTFGMYQAGIEGDWETRRLYTSLKHFQFSAPGRFDSFMTQARIGVSPFEAEFTELQSWFMLQAMVIDEIQETVMITPMLRFFYRNVLWEMGSSVRGDWMLNLMVHL